MTQQAILETVDAGWTKMLLGILFFVPALLIVATPRALGGEVRTVQVNCPVEKSQTIKLRPGEDLVQVILNARSCYCFDAPDVIKGQLKKIAEDILATEYDSSVQVRSFVDRLIVHPGVGEVLDMSQIQPGDTKTYRYYCYEKSQMVGYLEQVLAVYEETPEQAPSQAE